MKMRAFTCGLALAIFVVIASAADVTGKWKAEFQTPDGSTRTNTFTFKAEGEKLTGSVMGAAGEAPIQDGKISGDEISFSVTRNFGGQEVKLTYKGKVAGDEIKMTVDFGGQGGFEMTAKRQTT
jgi:hypothetical protein